MIKGVIVGDRIIAPIVTAKFISLFIIVLAYLDGGLCMIRTKEKIHEVSTDTGGGKTRKKYLLCVAVILIIVPQR